MVIRDAGTGQIQHRALEADELQAIVKTFELTDVPVRAGRFIARKNWIVCGSDDFNVRAYNYNTSEKVISFEAHPDYISACDCCESTGNQMLTARTGAIAVHPVQPFVLTASDDMTIKLWDWEKGWYVIFGFYFFPGAVLVLSCCLWGYRVWE